MRIFIHNFISIVYLFVLLVFIYFFQDKINYISSLLLVWNFHNDCAHNSPIGWKLSRIPFGSESIEKLLKTI